MESLIQWIGISAARTVLAVSFFIPVVLAGRWLINKRKELDPKDAEPFTDLPLRPPGESLRLKIDELFSDLQWDFLLLFLPVAGLALIVLQSPLGSLLIVWLIGFVLLLSWCFFRSRRLLKRGRELWNHRLGFMGERIVGEALNQLMLDGYRIFHDIPFDDFNIDHVAVGPSGVFVFETKSRRKAGSLKSRKPYEVIFDGKALLWPNGTQDSHGAEQAQRNAQTLAKFLSDAAAETTWVTPVLVLPGWMILRKAPGTVAVLNPKEIRKWMPKTSVLSADQIQRICYPLGEKCRLPKREDVE